MARPAVIFATHRPPLPLDNGQRIRTHRLAAGLSERCDVTVVTYADGPNYDGTTTTRAEIEDSLPGVRIELVHYDRRLPGGTSRDFVRRWSSTFGHYPLAGMRPVLARLLAERPAVLHLEDPGTGLAGIGLPAAYTGFAPHNIEYRIPQQLAPEKDPLRRLTFEIEWRKLRREERTVYRAADVCLACSELDAAEMRANGADRVELAPNATDPVDPLPWAPPAGSEPLRLMFVGTGDWPPYELGLGWFTREVMPRLREQGPVVFDVVGAPPKSRADAPDIVYHGRVPSVRPYYEAAHALVIPVFQGSGTRLKVVESALLGRPVISTALGAEGLNLEAGRHYLEADDADAFAHAALTLRRDSERVAGVLAAAREKLAHLTWPRVAARVADIYEAALESAGAR